MRPGRLLAEIKAKRLPFEKVEEAIYNKIMEHIACYGIYLGFHVTVSHTKREVLMDFRSEGYSEVMVKIPAQWGYTERVDRFMKSQGFVVNNDENNTELVIHYIPGEELRAYFQL